MSLSTAGFCLKTRLAIGCNSGCPAHWHLFSRLIFGSGFLSKYPRNGGCRSTATYGLHRWLHSSRRRSWSISYDLLVVYWQTLHSFFLFLVFSSGDEYTERQVGYCLPCFTRRVLSSLTSSKMGAVNPAAERTAWRAAGHADMFAGHRPAARIVGCLFETRLVLKKKGRAASSAMS